MSYNEDNLFTPIIVANLHPDFFVMNDSEPNEPDELDEEEPLLPLVRVARPGKVTNEVDKKRQIAQFVTTIKNAEQQVGEHIIQALQHEDTVAVITTVAMGADGQQRVISAALNPDRLQQVQEILQAAEEEREGEDPCIGFHCLVKPRKS